MAQSGEVQVSHQAAVKLRFLQLLRRLDGACQKVAGVVADYNRLQYRLKLEDVMSTSVAAGASTALSMLISGSQGHSPNISAVLAKNLSEAERKVQESLQRTANNQGSAALGIVAGSNSLSQSEKGGNLAYNAAQQKFLQTRQDRANAGGVYDLLYQNAADDYPTETELLNRRLMTDVVAYVKLLNKTLHHHTAEASRIDDKLQDIAEKYFPDAFFNEGITFDNRSY